MDTNSMNTKPWDATWRAGSFRWNPLILNFTDHFLMVRCWLTNNKRNVYYLFILYQTSKSYPDIYRISSLDVSYGLFVHASLNNGQRFLWRFL